MLYINMLHNLNNVYNACFVLLYNVYITANAEIFTAVSELEKLVITQNKTINELESYVRMQQKKLSLIKSLMDLYIRENKKAQEDILSYLHNPLNVFILVKRLVSDVEHSSSIIKTGIDLIPYMLRKHRDIVYPEHEDLIGAAQGVARLARVYNLHVTNLADGNLNNKAYSPPMTASDCYQLSRALEASNESFKARREWMLEAQRKYKEENVSYPFTAVDIVKYLNMANNISGNTSSKLWPISHKLNSTKLQVKTDRRTTSVRYECLVSLRLNTNKIFVSCYHDATEYFTNSPMQDNYHPDLFCQNETTSNTDEKELKNYEALCRGELIVPTKISKRLTCRYLMENHPFLKLAPYKIEMMYLNPDLILFHDVLSDIEIETIKQKAKPFLSRAQINDPVTGYLQKASYRISKIAWVFDDNCEILAQITKRIAHMTGLSMEKPSTKEKQVVNYGIGGHYEPHFDFTKKTEKFESLYTNRIATILFYMSDVAQGGATVFPELGVRLLPVKGTAAFWFNLHSSLEGNHATRHAACPVLQGDKWVVSKFIFREPQMFLRPCGLEYQEEGFDKKIPQPIYKTLQD